MSGTDLAGNYASAFAGRLAAGKTPALLLIDMVVAYLDPASPLYCETAGRALNSAVRLRDAAHRAGRLVVFTNVEYEPGGADGGIFYRKVPSLKAFDRGSPMGAFEDDLAPAAGDEVVTKQFPSAFFGTDLAERLRCQGIDTLVIGGFSTSGCVRASVVDAIQYGFVPLVVREACADRHKSPHEANLFDMQAKYAEVISEADAIRTLLHFRP